MSNKERQRTKQGSERGTEFYLNLHTLLISGRKALVFYIERRKAFFGSYSVLFK